MGKLFIPRKNSLLGSKRPRLEVEFADQLANWLAIEKWANNLGGGMVPVFEWPGPVLITSTDLLPVPVAGAYTKAYVTAQTAATTATTVQLYKNGSLQNTLTVASGLTIQTLTINIVTVVGDYLQGSVTTPGTGLVGLTIALG